MNLDESLEVSWPQSSLSRKRLLQLLHLLHLTKHLLHLLHLLVLHGRLRLLGLHLRRCFGWRRLGRLHRLG